MHPPSDHRNLSWQALRKPTDTVVALERGIAVLHCFLHGPVALSHGDIVRRTGIPKPTVTRLVATLMVRGYLRQIGGERYALGPVRDLARPRLSVRPRRPRTARPFMTELADRFNASTYLAVRDQAGDGDHRSLPLALDHAAVPPRRRLAGAADDLRPRPRLSRGARRPGPERLAAAVHRSRAGRSTARCATRRRTATASPSREWHPDIGAIATVIQAPDGAILALNCGGPVFRFDDQYLRRKVAPHLLEAARAIAQEIGGKAMSPADSRRLAAAAS